jgi:hypothetical protein
LGSEIPDFCFKKTFSGAENPTEPQILVDENFFSGNAKARFRGGIGPFCLLIMSLA